MMYNAENKKIKAFMMVGLQGSGKSTEARKLAEKENAVIFSSDNYRKIICGDESAQDNNQEVFAALYRDLREALKSGKNVIFDATNINMKDRARFFNQIKGIENVEVIAIVVNTLTSDCILRDKYRERRVGERVILKYRERFQCPQKFEGFSEIRFVETALLTTMDIASIMCGVDQQNPHHINTLDKHCRKLASFYTQGSVEYNAGLIHDIGKCATKSIDDQGIAHYYGHDNVGAYLLVCNLSRAMFHSDDDYLKCICLVNYHMKFHKDWCTEKYKKLFGEDLYNKLIEFAEYDKEASGTNSIHDDIIHMQKVDKLSYEEIVGSETWQKCKKEHSYAI